MCAAINDINPQAPVHVLLFPAKPIERLAKAEESDAPILAHLMLKVPEIAKKCGLDDGFRVVINNGLLAGETVPHLHIHILADAPSTGRPAEPFPRRATPRSFAPAIRNSVLRGGKKKDNLSVVLFFDIPRY